MKTKGISTQEKFHKRRTHEGFIHESLDKKSLFKRLPLKRQKAYKQKIRLSNMEYNFLQYSRMIRTWAKRNYKITDKYLDILLYLYPINIFSKKQFTESIKEMGIVDYTAFTKLNKDGWVVLWAKPSRKHYYVLSHKGNELVKKMHRMCMNEEEVPMSERRNVIVRSRKKQDMNLTELFKIFNKKVRENG